ncbi:TPA: helix-turn-helix transcriptional regulator, partial [Escherichia coli]|nr:helix-turn-helix transcriptional regulator [Escherichia coli]
LNNIIKIMSHFYYEGELKNKRHTQHNTDDYALCAIETDALSNELFRTIKTTSNYRIKLYSLACFLSKAKNPQHLFNSLIISTTTLFSDKIRRIIERDTSKKWNLSDIAKECYLSEISIRKKLSAENTSFYQILLDVRMKKAAMLILRNELQISNIPYMIGISSVSHFIKIFNLYYGLTPKNFLIKHKEQCILKYSNDI